MPVLCPECENPVVLDVDEVEEGDTLSCEDCGAELEVLSLDPLKLGTVDDSGYDDPEDSPFGNADEGDDE